MEQGKTLQPPRKPKAGPQDAPAPAAFMWKLWIYANFDCNLKCSYCVAKSGPKVPRRALGRERVRRLVDEAVRLGFEQVFFTGGEPFLLEDIYGMLAHASGRIKTTVLTNAMLLRGRRLEQLSAIANPNLIVQVSLDGGRPEDHDAYRGPGTWQKTMEGIQLLQARGFRVRLGTTETPVNSGHLQELCKLHRSMGIPDEDHFVRPLAKRGYSREGLELDMGSLIPEVTVSVDGVFWHPLSTDADMQVSRNLFPLAEPVHRIREQLAKISLTGKASLMTFT
jgi:MoaA/NifB/PqqE/SkfB family radical SAM enzyme